MLTVVVACFDILNCLLHTPDQQNSCVKRCDELNLFMLLVELKNAKKGNQAMRYSNRFPKHKLNPKLCTHSNVIGNKEAT